MTDTVLWAFSLLGLALVLFVVEVFVPSGGIIGFFAFLVTMGGLVMLFLEDTVMGLIATILCVLLLPVLFGFSIWIWPSTPIARLFTLHMSQQRLTDPQGEDLTTNDDLVGAEGRALTDLRPIGTCQINGRRTECLATTGVISAGQKVCVVSVDGMQIKVRKV